VLEDMTQELRIVPVAAHRPIVREPRGRWTSPPGQ
jgi:hypothetical protein